MRRILLTILGALFVFLFPAGVRAEHGSIASAASDIDELVPVTFQVNMSVKMIEGTFAPLSSGEWVSVRGSFNGWSAVDTLRDGNFDSIYTKTVLISEETDIAYKFVIRNDDGSDTWEELIGGDRMYHVPPGGGTIPVVWLDNDSEVDVPVVQNILLKTDLEAYSMMGWFNPALGDSVQVRGAFNGWASGAWCNDPHANFEYEYLLLNHNGFAGDDFPYKFYLVFDEATAPTRFPGWTPGVGADGWGYEHPAVGGDGNRIYVLPLSNGNVFPDMYDYSDIDPAGILFSPDEVEVTLTADMTPAMIQGFDPNTDMVNIWWGDALWRSVQVLYQGVFPEIWNMTRQGITNTSRVKFRVVGTTHYNMQYRLQFVKPDGSETTEGGGLGFQNPFRTRFIQPTAPNTFPPNYSAPVDVWDADGPPLPGEYPPYDPHGGSLSCNDIFFFAAKCNRNGAAQSMVKMHGDYTGETITFDLDGVDIVSTVMSNGTNSIAKMTVPHAGYGSHTVTLEDPAGCYSPVTFNCQVDASPDPEWDALWAEYGDLPAQASKPHAETGIVGNFPNPFNPSTTFRYGLSDPGQMSLKVYNVLGQLVRTIVDEHQVAGYHEAIWDGRNEVGAVVSSGIYMYRMTAGTFVETKRMLLTK